MKRKLIGQGHNTMTVTLPSNWIKKLNLQNKDEVDVIEDGSSLIITTGERPKEKSITIEISDLVVSMLWRYFEAIYRNGYNEIKVVFDPNKKNYPDIYHPYSSLFADTKYAKKLNSKSAVDMIQDLVNRFVGMEIIETGKNYCVIRDMTEPTAKEYDNALRRIFMLVSGIFERILDAIKNNEIGNKKILNEIHALDVNIDRFVDYCHRMLNKLNFPQHQNKRSSVFTTLFILELLSNEFKYIADHLSRANKRIDNVLPFCKMVNELFLLYQRLFYNFDRKLTIELGKRGLAICEEHIKLKKRIVGENKSIARHFVQISKYLLTLTELRIEMEFNQY